LGKTKGIPLILADGEACEHFKMKSQDLGTAKKQNGPDMIPTDLPNIAAAWDNVYGNAYFASHIPDSVCIRKLEGQGARHV
jgi:hypothetical protein